MSLISRICCRGTSMAVLTICCAAMSAGLADVASARAASSNEKPPLRMGIFPALRPLEIIRAEGYLEKMGYKVNWINFPKYAPAEAAAAAAGAIDFAEADTSGLMQMDAKSPGLYWYIANGSSNYVAIVARKDSKINSIKGLKGKRVGGVILNSAPYAVLRLGLAKAGLTLKDLQPLNIVGPSQAPAMQRNAIQAAVSWVPYDSQMLATGDAKLVTTASQIYGQTWPGGGIVVRPQFAKAHRQAVIDVMKAVIKAEALLRHDPERAYKDFAKMTGTSLSNVKYSYVHGLVGPIDPLPNKKQLENQIGILVKYHVIHVPSASDFTNQLIHPEFMKDAESQSRSAK